MNISGLGGSGFMDSIIWIILGTIVLGLCGLGLFYFFRKKKSWNLKIEFKIPRNIREIKKKDGSILVKGSLNKEWGKGYYNAKEGVVYLKRKGKKPVSMKPFDVKRYLSDNGILTVIQIGIEDYRPVLDDSYIEVVDDKTGEEAALIKAKIDTSEGKSWRNSYERERKNTYTLSNWLREHGQILAFGIMVMMILVGFGILWTRLPKICG
jgi:hypothetical protein